MQTLNNFWVSSLRVHIFFKESCSVTSVSGVCLSSFFSAGWLFIKQTGLLPAGETFKLNALLSRAGSPFYSKHQV